jgi:small subunit ribosomal protein S1
VQALIEKPEAHVVEGSGGLLLEIDGQIVPNYDATMQPFEEGEVVTGRVVRIDKDEVLVDIGYKSEGVIPSGELSIRKSVDPHEEVELGEEVDAIVLTKEDQDGRLIMSKKRARFEKAWRRIEAAAESGQPVEGTVIEVVKGGLIIDLGVRGFLPASLVDIRRVPNLDEYMGTKIETKVIELNRSRNNVVLSRRAVLEEERKEVRQQILDRLQPGLVVEGQISNIVDFGAFVDLDGIDGLIHISELSWSHVNHPSEILNIGDTVQVKVLDIDRDRQRISLGLKQTQEDPWQRIVDTYNVGDELEGTVTKVVTFGAFVEILDGVEGLVHISELAAHHVESPREVVHTGDEIRVKILEIDSERRRLSLSAKRVEDQILPLPRSAAAAVGELSAVALAGEAEFEGESSAEVLEGQLEAGVLEGETSTEVLEGQLEAGVLEGETSTEVLAGPPEAGVAETEDAVVESQPEAGVTEGQPEAGTVEGQPEAEEPASVGESELGVAGGSVAVEGEAADAATETAPNEVGAATQPAEAGEPESAHPSAAVQPVAAAEGEASPELAGEAPADGAAADLEDPELAPAVSDSPEA